MAGLKSDIYVVDREHYDQLIADREVLLKALKVAYQGLTEYQTGDEFDEKVDTVFSAIQKIEAHK